ncbi:Glycosyltransferase, GT2 family [Algoriphagus ornithinivorans]|uniref:Glycosyltransferase, GT2 family n=1 Tax=Algoriphagus ornithinivorans TaxID=226506 RepID=A0A1I5HHX1_9BACT|nr:glycosyltransferase family A protein [Algoriphagus ornithinivorans]SFO47827.1 Glycosyltransferase, GT2 family [Algoriphagus ornithinivorans]
MSTSTLFTVIIPVYRDNDRLIKCLKTILNQTVSLDIIEVLIINNDPKFRISLPIEFITKLNLQIILEEKPGSYAARNKGIAQAKGQIFAFTDSDCLLSENWLKVAYEYFSNDKRMEIGILTGPVPLFFKNPKVLSDAEVYEKYTGFTTESYAKEGYAITANWLSPAFVIKEFGGFNADLKSNGDSELSGRISQKYKIVYSPKLIVHHPARYYTEDLVNKYKRLLGGAFVRRFHGKPKEFRKHVKYFIWRRYRFAFKKFFTISLKESLAILKVCNAINKGAWEEYKSLINGGETKR